MISDEHAGRLSFAANRLENLKRAKYIFIERMKAARNLTRDAWARQHTESLISTAEAEIIEIEAAIHDIRFVRENA